ncbi:MAG: hypothetical protein UU63_C0053G0006, partial [Candidatus Uhrbacteria bacterium GW2011_GWF2_41_430]
LLKDWLLITIAFALGFQTVHLISFQCLHRKLRWALLERATASCSATELPPNVAFIQLMHEKTIIIPKLIACGLLLLFSSQPDNCRAYNAVCNLSYFSFVTLRVL